MISKRRISFTAGVVILSIALGVLIPSAAPAIFAVNSHAARLSLANNDPTMMFWTNNVTNSLTPAQGQGILITVDNAYQCGPFGVQAQPYNGTLPRPSPFSASVSPGPGWTLVIIDAANSSYCHSINP